MTRALIIGCAVLAFVVPLRAENLARNPSFELDADGNGLPDQWQTSGDSWLVEQSLTSDAGRDGWRNAHQDVSTTVFNISHRNPFLTRFHRQRTWAGNCAAI